MNPTVLCLVGMATIAASNPFSFSNFFSEKHFPRANPVGFITNTSLAYSSGILLAGAFLSAAAVKNWPKPKEEEEPLETRASSSFFTQPHADNLASGSEFCDCSKQCVEYAEESQYNREYEQYLKAYSDWARVYEQGQTDFPPPTSPTATRRSEMTYDWSPIETTAGVPSRLKRR